ncbi:alpha/beta hydrolase [Hymenobacter sp. 15J16-1T3B]|uniref:alpha/beta hydrolase n=1 Tax=Hymenobacter sp. 15J16-1T3B TaxID=2886941 RepID=UPI001D119DFA|nr:alpha/beta hydrolase-fold protein [Hymenobacter sp. 15J16-1T3B]MCC3160056.1 alpha/beta hydrolase [Hymenobacter sp. 15J16-1T3B]
MKSTWFVLLVLALLSSWPGTAAAQSAAAPLVIGETFTLESKVLGETRRLNVYLPPGYAESPSLRLPVLYMPDGGLNEDFLHVAGLVQVSVGNETMRPFILVGIANTERRRDMTGPTEVAEDKKIAPRVGGSAAFREFIRTELMPAVRARYRTTDETAVVGESLAGLFVVETLLLEPALFTSYVAIDPSLWWNRGALAGQAAKLLQTQPSRFAGKAVYLAISSQGDDQHMHQLTEALAASAARTGLRSQYDPLPSETHATIYHPAALRAFRLLFKPAPPKK